MLSKLFCAFRDGWNHVSRRKCIHHDRHLRTQLREHQLDATIEDSMPASDPPSTY